MGLSYSCIDPFNSLVIDLETLLCSLKDFIADIYIQETSLIS